MCHSANAVPENIEWCQASRSALAMIRLLSRMQTILKQCSDEE